MDNRGCFVAWLILLAIMLGVFSNYLKAETLSIGIENDYFTGSDDSYSNGLMVTYASEELSFLETDSTFKQWFDTFSFLPGLKERPGNYRHVNFAIIHELHTPTDITLTDPPLNDQPYSSILMLSSSLSSFSEAKWGHIWNLRAGLSGPATGGKFIQREFHRLIDDQDPKGWSTQIPNEPIVNIGYLGGYTFPPNQIWDNYTLRLTPAVNIEAGNYLTGVGAGVIVEFGKNLPIAPLISSLGQGLGSTVVSTGWRTSELSYGLYFGIANYHIFHYLPLDGTVFQNSRSVDYDTNVFMGSAGFSVQKGRWQVSFGITYQGPGTSISDDDVDFGTLTIAYNF